MRSLSERISEHRLDYEHLRDGRTELFTAQSSAMALHCHRHGHQFEDVKVTLIHQCQKGSILNQLEQIEIIIAAKRSRNNLLNQLKYTCKNPLVTHVTEYDESND